MTLSWQQVLSHKYQYKYQYPKVVLKYRSSTSTSTQYNKTGTNWPWYPWKTTRYLKMKKINLTIWVIILYCGKKLPEILAFVQRAEWNFFIWSKLWWHVANITRKKLSKCCWTTWSQNYISTINNKTEYLIHTHSVQSRQVTEEQAGGQTHKTLDSRWHFTQTHTCCTHLLYTAVQSAGMQRKTADSCWYSLALLSHSQFNW